MRWMRTVLALTSLGAIGLAARLIYPDRAADAPDDAPDRADDTRV